MVKFPRPKERDFGWVGFILTGSMISFITVFALLS